MLQFNVKSIFNQTFNSQSSEFTSSSSHGGLHRNRFGDQSLRVTPNKGSKHHQVSLFLIVSFLINKKLKRLTTLHDVAVLASKIRR